MSRIEHISAPAGGGPGQWLQLARAWPSRAIVIVNLVNVLVNALRLLVSWTSDGARMPTDTSWLGLVALLLPFLLLFAWLLRRLWASPTRTVLLIYALVFGVPLLVAAIDGSIAQYPWVALPLDVLLAVLIVLAWNEPRVVRRQETAGGQ